MDLTTKVGRREQGQRIQRAAEEAGYSLEELARAIGCSRGLIYQYVSGGVLAQPNRLQRIAELTRRPLVYFFEEAPAAVGAEPSAAAPNSPASGTREDSTGEPPEALVSLAPRTGGFAASGTAPIPPPVMAGAEPPEIARLALRYLEEMADLQESFGDSQGLLATCERIVPYTRQLGDREREAWAWLRIGNARIQRGHHDLAVPALQVALAMFEELGSTALALACRQSIGRARLSAGDTEGSLAEFRRVAGGPAWTNQWQGAVSLAAVYEHRGDFRKALECCESAAEIVGNAADAPEEMVEAARSYIVSNQANVYLACGDFTNAHRLSQEMLLAAERSNQREQFVEALINLGICQSYRGEWDQADENLNRALDLSRFAGDLPRAAFSRALIAFLRSEIGDIETAKEEAKDALQVGLETASRRSEIQAHLSLGEAYLPQAPREALYHFNQACRAASSSASLTQQILAVQRRSVAHRALGDETRALEDAERALLQAQEHGISHVEAMAQETRSHLREASGDLEGAMEDAAAALQLAERLGLDSLACRAGAHLAALLQNRGESEEAVARGAAAVERLRTLRERVLNRWGEEELLVRPEALAIYQQQAERLTAAGKLEEAIALVEQAHWPPLTSVQIEGRGESRELPQRASTKNAKKSNSKDTKETTKGESGKDAGVRAAAGEIATD